MHEVWQARRYGETELDRAAGLLAGRGEAVLTEEAQAAFAKRYEESRTRGGGRSGSRSGRPEGRPLIAAEWIELTVIGVFLFADWLDSFRAGNCALGATLTRCLPQENQCQGQKSEAPTVQ